MGVASTITGTSVIRAGGGGGGGYTGGNQNGALGGYGGSGGGGNGAANVDPNTTPSIFAQSGTVNTGGGAGGSGTVSSSITGIKGGSGIVILRYDSSLTISNPGGGLTFSTATVGSDKVTQFTQGTGTIQFG